MMQFRTQIDVPRSSFAITHDLRGISLGSCFAATIGERLVSEKFPVLVNPFGTIYNPASIKNCVDLLFGNRSLGEDDVFLANGVWQSFLLHTDFSSVEKEDVLRRFQDVVATFRQRFSSPDYVILTLGTAWVYELVSSGEIVSNCHKLPANQFTRRKLSVAECVEVLQQSIGIIKKANPNVRIITTVSPIRHWKDGAHENQLSKSTLLLALDEVQKRNENVLYFPAYEIVMDDLRDYRFYADDMLHVGPVAVEYIWNQFCSSFFRKDTMDVMKRIEAIARAVSHRPFNPGGEEHQRFVLANLQECDRLAKDFPSLDFSEERKRLQLNLKCGR